jgi:hypothetical protein
MTSSCHRCLGLPTGLVPIGFQSNSLLTALVWPILCIWPSHLILCALMNLTVSAPYINLSISMFRILHVLSILTGPNIFLSICLSKTRKLFSPFAVTVPPPPVSDQYITTGLIIVLYIFILVLLFRDFDFISFALAQYACCTNTSDNIFSFFTHTRSGSNLRALSLQLEYHSRPRVLRNQYLTLARNYTQENTPTETKYF